MRRCLASLLIWTISTSALAPAGIPACAKLAVSSGMRGSGCANGDISCMCTSEHLNSAIQSAIEVCNEDDEEALYDTIEKLCYNEVLEVRDVDEDAEVEVEEDTPSGTVASEGTDQATLQTPVVAETPTIASEGTDQATLKTPVVGSTPTIASEGTDQATLGTPVPASTPTIASEGTDQATLSTPVPASTPTIASEGTDQATTSTPTVIAPPKTPLPTTATSIVTDTREFSYPKSSENSVVTTQQAADDDPSGLTSATTTSPGQGNYALISANVTSSSLDSTLGQSQSHSQNQSNNQSQSSGTVTGEAAGEVAVSVGALIVAVAGLTWVFAEF